MGIRISFVLIAIATLCNAISIYLIKMELDTFREWISEIIDAVINLYKCLDEVSRQ